MADSGTSYGQNHLTPAQQFLTCGQHQELWHSSFLPVGIIMNSCTAVSYLWAESRTPAQQFLTCGQNHELLHGQLVAGMAATVDDVEGWHRQHQSLVAGQISQVLVQGNSLPSEKNKTKQDRVN